MKKCNGTAREGSSVFCSPNHPKSVALVNGSALTSLRVVPLRSSTVDPTRGVRLGGDGRSTSA